MNGARANMAIHLSKIPNRVILSAIGYKVVVHENMVLFTCDARCGPCFTKMIFTRRCGCWHVEISDSDNAIMVSHITQASEYVEAWFGANFDSPNGEHKL